MGFFDFLKAKNGQLGWKKTLVKDMVMLTAIDGEMDDDEIKEVLNIAVNDLGFSEQEFVDLMKNLGKVQDNYPSEPKMKLEYLTSLLKITYADGYLDDNEIAYIKIIANRMGLDDNSIDKAIAIIEKLSTQSETLDSNDGMRLDDAEVDVMFIVKNNQLMYVNDRANHLFEVDKDGDLKLDGRIVKFNYFTKNDQIIEVFVAFDDEDSYTMFTLKMGIDERLNYVARAILEYFYEKKINNIFNFTDEYQTQFEYTFKLYQKNNQFFMVNNSQSQSFIVDGKKIIRSDDYSVDILKNMFWN